MLQNNCSARFNVVFYRFLDTLYNVIISDGDNNCTCLTDNVGVMGKNTLSLWLLHSFSLCFDLPITTETGGRKFAFCVHGLYMYMYVCSVQVRMLSGTM